MCSLMLFEYEGQIYAPMGGGPCSQQIIPLDPLEVDCKWQVIQITNIWPIFYTKQ